MSYFFLLVLYQLAVIYLYIVQLNAYPYPALLFIVLKFRILFIFQNTLFTSSIIQIVTK